MLKFKRDKIPPPHLPFQWDSGVYRVETSRGTMWVGCWRRGTWGTASLWMAFTATGEPVVTATTLARVKARLRSDPRLLPPVPPKTEG